MRTPRLLHHNGSWFKASKTSLAFVLALLWAMFFPNCHDVQATTTVANARELYKSGNLPAAKDAFIDLTCENPRYYPYRYWLGIISLGLKDYDEAQANFEFCLEMYPDARTASFCHQAIEMIDRRLGRPERVDLNFESDFQAALMSQGALRRLEAEKAIWSQRSQVLGQASANARQIQTQAQNRIDELRRNATWWTLDLQKGEIVPVVSKELEKSITENADRLADTVMSDAGKKADELKMPETDSVTEGLLSQLKASGKSAPTHLVPLGSNVYVRNYAHTLNPTVWSKTTTKM